MYLWEVVISMLTIIKTKHDQLWKMQKLPHPTVSNVQPRFNSYVKINKYINSIFCKLAFIFSKGYSNINWNLFLNNFSDLSWVSTWFLYLFNIPICPGSYKKFLSQKGIKKQKTFKKLCSNVDHIQSNPHMFGFHVHSTNQLRVKYH